MTKKGVWMKEFLQNREAGSVLVLFENKECLVKHIGSGEEYLFRGDVSF